MASTNSVADVNLPEAEGNDDFISNLPSNMIEKILKCLPLATVARMSLVSKTWRRYWLSHRYLVFDKAFWDGLGEEGNGSYFEWQRNNNIINNILFNHVGPVYKFHLYIPECNLGQELNFGPWISFLSRIGVRKITILNWGKFAHMPSHIFACKDLLHLKVDYCSMYRPPSDFNGFAYLQSLELEDVEFKNDLCSILIAKCPRLTVLRLTECTGLKNLVIDAPSLETLFITGVFETLGFNNVPRLRCISIALEKMRKTSKADTVDAVKILSSSCELEELNFGGQMCKLLAAGGITHSRAVAFNHLRKLCLSEINLGDRDQFYFTFGMVRSCPFVELLEISVIPGRSDVQHKVDYNKDYKLGRLLKVLVTGLTGSSAELELIKFVLAVSIVLEELSFKCHDLDPISMSQELSELPRASSEAKLVCLEQ